MGILALRFLFKSRFAIFEFAIDSHNFTQKFAGLANQDECTVHERNMVTSTKKQLLPYAIVTLFGLIGFTLPLPILPKMFLDSEYSIVPHAYSLGLRNFLLGLVMMSFLLGQILGSPLLGRLSDRYGRKLTIILSLAGNSLGYLLRGASILLANVPGVFLGKKLQNYVRS